MSGYQKNIRVFSVFAAGILALFLSCDNPFSNNLGAKVDVEYPTIMVYGGRVTVNGVEKDFPLPGGFVQGLASFSGLARAYREVRRVEVRILDPSDEKELPPLLPWTDITKLPPHTMTTGTLSGSAKEKTWTFSLDTQSFPNQTRHGLDDGFLKMQFRSFDPNLESEITTMVYVIKNASSIVKVTSPAEIPTNTEILGNVIDRRGIKPGYPQIKIWPEGMSEPGGDDPNWGWTALFLSGIDNVEEAAYAADPPRTGRAVARSANFAFRLAQFTIDPDTRQAKYDRSVDGSGKEAFKPLKTGMYRYRIMTKDTFFNEDVNNADSYMLPREADPLKGEVETIGYFPPVANPYDETAKDSGPYYEISVLASGERPRIALNNDDIRAVRAELLEEQPNIYILEDESTAKKIKKIAKRDDQAADPNKYTDFRLRIVTAHPDGIESATLQWEHSAGAEVRTGYLMWDNDIPDSGGYVNDVNNETKAENGHRGAWDAALQGTVFRFTAPSDLTHKDTVGKEQMVFTGSTEPYTLTVTVNSTSKMQAVQKYTLYVNGDGPSVAIRSIRGAAESPQEDAINVTGGTFNESPYTVNDNIQIAISRTANMGFMRQDRFNKPDYPVVKWALEEADTAGKTEGALKANAQSIYHQLLNFRENPTAETLAFFNNLNDETTMNGWITEADQTKAFDEDKYDNLKISVRKDEGGTNQWHRKELWLYIMAQDAIHNLGYTVQKLYVDDDSDIPALNVPGLSDTNTTISALDDLYIPLNTHNGLSKPRVNVLDRNEGIALNFTDDDNILPAEIVIRITEHNTGRTRNVNAAAMIGSESVLRTWDGTLSQSVLGGALYGNGEGIPTWLEDGIYTLTINIKDHVPSKVQIGNTPPQSKSTSLAFHFAVQSELPRIEVLRPRGENTMQTDVPIPVFGTVRSRLKIQKLDVVFTPDLNAANIDAANPPSSAPEQPELYIAGILGEHADGINYTLTVDTQHQIQTGGTGLLSWKDIMPGSDGYYTYYWKIKNEVNFDPAGLFPTQEKFDWRRFDLRAWDGLGDLGIASCTVDVDTTPPEVDLLEFNHNRLHIDNTVTVNGKVVIEINAYDLNKIGRDETRAYIKWWALPEDWQDHQGSDVPVFETPFPRVTTDGVYGGNHGGGGWFAYNGSDTIYRTVFDVSDSTHYPKGNYNLYIIAEDSAGNHNTASSIQAFIIDPDSDYPALRPEIPLSPLDGDIVGTLSATAAVTAIKGSIADDDGFDSAKINAYVQIRFPLSQSAASTVWGDWIPVTNNNAGNSVTRNDIGDIEFVFNINTPVPYHPDYLKTDGEKRYQIKVKDEVAAGPNNVPPGKNPDGVNTIGAVTTILPDDASCYTFFIKNTPPMLFFAQNDPVEFSKERPIFASAAQLEEALNNGWVRESMLQQVYFTYGNSPASHLFTFNAAPDPVPGTYRSEGDRYIWTIDPAWLGSPDKSTGFYAGGSGMHSITIEATDTLGNLRTQEWSFYKDITGPAINFNNISMGAVQTISGEAGKVYITGQFNDNYSNIAETLSFLFDSIGGNLDALQNQQPVTLHGGSVNGKSAVWSVPVPGSVYNDPSFPDGKHTFTIRIRDVLGNETTEGPIEFIIDRQPPQMISSADMNVVNNIINRPLDEHERVFSAAIQNENSNTPVFTLSGTVYEHNLSQLRASVRNSTGSVMDITLDGITEWLATANPPEFLGTNFRIRKADAAHTYVWSLDIRERDVYALLDASKNVPDQGSERRSIAITARDTGRVDSNREVWSFFLDSSKPVITLSNLNHNKPRLDDREISLQGSVADATNIKTIHYRIEKYHYTESKWGSATADDWTPYTDSLGITYDGAQETQRDAVYFSIQHDAFNDDGLYRFSIMATDWSLAASQNTAGNPNTDYSEIEFYVDRNDPVIQWAWDHNANAEQKNFYRRDKHNTIVFEDIMVSDINKIASITGELLVYGTAIPITAVSVSASVKTGDPAFPAQAAMITVTIKDSAAALDNGRYTLRLTVTDEAGRTASVNNAFSFYLDNKKPTITIAADSGSSASGGVEAITGRVMLRGRFFKDPSLSPIARAAYAVRRDYTQEMPVPESINMATGNVLNGPELRSKGWVFNEGRNDNENVLFDNGMSLMDINEGLATANILLYNTRNFYNTNYIGAEQTVAQANAAINGTITFGGVPVADTEMVRPLTIYFLAIDEAGNSSTGEFNYWVYPRGDYPEINVISNPNKMESEVNRQLNGRIRIAGNATDNYRVRHVWFRILKDGYNGAAADPADFEPAMNLSIPVWDEFWNATSRNQSPRLLVKDGKSYGDGWYMANGGGKPDVSWWAYVNTEGELDPGMATSRVIIVEVMAEDTYWVDSMNDNDGGYNSDNNLLSEVNSVRAFVVNGAPRFEDEKVLAGKSSEYPVTHPRWGNILTTYVKGRASYSVVVKHNSGIKEIRWTPPGNSAAVNLLEGNYADYSTHLFNMDTQGYDPSTNPGIAVRAGPKKLITQNDINGGYVMAGKTFMIWTPDPALLNIALENRTNLTGNELQQYTIFTVKEHEPVGAIGGAQLLQKTAESPEGAFEWVVIADLNSAILPSNEGIAGVTGYTDRAGYYTLTLSATEISKPIGLTAAKHAAIPIDNIAPRALYTHSTNVAGSSPSFGGEAGDIGSPGGLSRVVLWFSRIKNGKDTSIAWNEKDGGVFSGDNSLLPAGVALPDGVTMPKILEEGDPGYNDPQYSYIVIDRHDPLGNQWHHGHKRGMGFAAVGGDMGMSWYVYLDSTKIESGRVRAHYIVYDRAGNGRYYNQKLMILNGIARISRITLATNTGVNTDLQSILGSANANVSFNETDITTSGGALGRIRDAMGAAYTSDTARGISGVIGVDTTRPGEYSVTVDQPYFNVRGGLLAIRVETDAGQSSTEKNRHYRVEYVSGARPITGVDSIKNAATGVKAGKVYIVNDPGSVVNRFPWGSLGAATSGVQGETYRRGLVFLALEDGHNIETANVNYGNPSVWELNSDYYKDNNPDDPLERTFPSDNLKLDPVIYDKLDGSKNNPTGIAADFVYGKNAFGVTDGSTINDFIPYLDTIGRPLPYPSTGETEPWLAHSLFIIKVYDGPESDLFGDFALLAVRVNNNDVTPPYAQLYDLNPKTEGGAQNISQALATGTTGQMGANRVKGGLHKDGHIEPRKTTGLTSVEMGGAAGSPSITAPAARTDAFFDVDTLSGKVIVRGYAEDDQRVGKVQLGFITDGGAQTITILEERADGIIGDNHKYFLQRADGITGQQVDYTETVDLNRHRVEWTYYWNTEDMPYHATAGDFAVGDVTVLVMAHNANKDLADGHRGKTSGERTFADASGRTWDYFNPGYPLTSGDIRRYNSIGVQLRPYITGFKRNDGGFAHNERSRQGWYMFARGEPVVATGFNLSYQGAAQTAAANVTTIYLPGAADGTGTAQIGSADAGDFNSNNLHNKQVTAAHQETYFRVDNNIMHNRIFTVPVDAANSDVKYGDGTIRLKVTRNDVNYWAVNTASEADTAAANSANGCRPRIRIGGIDRPVVQPWNMERNPGHESSDLWDDFTRAHIWRSDDANTGADNSRFAANANWVILNPAMSIDPADGTLYSSHCEGGSGGSANGNGGMENSGTSRLSSNTSIAANNVINVAQFYDPIIMSDVYRSPGGGGIGAATWTTFSVIGRAATSNGWNSYGGILAYGPQGRPAYLENGIGLATGQGHYMVESAYYNSNNTFASNNGGVRYTDQFENPHIVTAISGSGTGAREHIHISYYDNKDGSIKYRYNYRSDTTAINADNNNLRTWINLDGGYDDEDIKGPGSAATGSRVVDYAVRQNGSAVNLISAGQHNAIAVTSDGYPVVAYFDSSNQRLKLAVSNSAVPTDAGNWVIRNYVIPQTNLSSYGTGQYVSLKIDITVNPNIVHMAALNAVTKQLVYITGKLNPAVQTDDVLTDVAVQVVDSVGDVGRWCSLSLDENGNPWIAYQDEGYRNSRDGVKMAYLNKSRFYKGVAQASGESFFAGRDTDINGGRIDGWEAMHIPTQYRITDARIGMECFPARNVRPNPGAARNWNGAVSYLAPDYYRIAYYVK